MFKVLMIKIYNFLINIVSEKIESCESLSQNKQCVNPEYCIDLDFMFLGLLYKYHNLLVQHLSLKNYLIKQDHKCI